MECEKGKGDKEWREQKWEERIIYKIHLWNCWVTGRVKLQTSSLSPSVSSSPTSPTPRHTACPHPTAAVNDKHIQERGWGILLLHSHPVLPALLSSHKLIKTQKIWVNRKNIYSFTSQTADWGLAVKWLVFGHLFDIAFLLVFDWTASSHSCVFQKVLSSRLQIQRHFNSHSLRSQMVLSRS